MAEFDPKFIIYDIKGVEHRVNINDVVKLSPGKVTLANGYTIKIQENPNYVKYLAAFYKIPDKLDLE